MIDCDTCHRWYHMACAGVCEETVAALGRQGTSAQWNCPPCRLRLEVGRDVRDGHKRVVVRRRTRARRRRRRRRRRVQQAPNKAAEDNGSHGERAQGAEVGAEAARMMGADFGRDLDCWLDIDRNLERPRTS